MTESTVNVDPQWNVATRIAFRFCFIYFGVYILLTQMLTSLVPFIPTEIGAIGPFRAIISWTAKHVFHVGYALVVTGSGSGDKTFDWVETVLHSCDCDPRDDSLVVRGSKAPKPSKTLFLVPGVHSSLAWRDDAFLRRDESYPDADVVPDPQSIAGAVW